MKKLACLLLWATLCLGTGSCHLADSNAHSEGGGEDTTATLKASDENLSREEQEKVLLERARDIYNYVERVYSPGAPEGTDIDLNKKYGSTRWNRLVEEVAIADSHTDDYSFAFVAGEPWIMGQDCKDLHADNFKVMSIDGDRAAVMLDLHNHGTVTPVRVEFVREDGQWMIDNFVSGVDGEDGYNWQEMMLNYIKEYK